jgi:hypothetical protein
LQTRKNKRGRRLGGLKGDAVLGKIFEVAYVIGYWLYVGFAAYMLWPSDGIFTWISFVVVHAMVATVWPVGLLLWYVGYFH